MRIIISPAKKMNVDTDSLPQQGLPVFLSKTKILLQELQNKDLPELKKLWKCSDKLAQTSFEQLWKIKLEGVLTPAILAYDGIQYQHMAPAVFNDQELLYIQNHLRILSGFYGVVRPMDGVSPYRLEMQAKLAVQESRDLYDFWGDSIANELFFQTDTIINLASQEYSRCVSRYLKEGIRMITCTFGEEIDEKVIEKGTLCKMARGEMVRFMAENQIEQPEKLREFSRIGYCFSEKYSDSTNYVFLKVK